MKGEGKTDKMIGIKPMSDVKWRGGAGWVRSRLLAAPMALHGPSQQLLHVPRHVHGVVQVEVSLRIQHGFAPACRPLK